MFANFGIDKYPLNSFKYFHMQILIYLICKKRRNVKNGRKSTFISKNPKGIDERLKDCSYKKRDNLNRYGCNDTGGLPKRTITINAISNNI